MRQAHAHAYDLADIAHHEAQHAKLHAHWRALFGARILQVDYEKLVRGGADMAAQIAAHCGIPFDADIALPEFQEDEIGGWKCYEKHLQPFHDRLVGIIE